MDHRERHGSAGRDTAGAPWRAWWTLHARAALLYLAAGVLPGFLLIPFGPALLLHAGAVFGVLALAASALAMPLLDNGRRPARRRAGLSVLVGSGVALWLVPAAHLLLGTIADGFAVPRAVWWFSLIPAAVYATAAGLALLWERHGGAGGGGPRPVRPPGP